MQKIYCIVIVLFLTAAILSDAAHISIETNWKKSILKSNTIPTLQIVVNPKTIRQSDIYRQVYDSLRNLEADLVRFVPWNPYPRLAVAELEPPTCPNTSWNFTLIDPLIKDFVEATDGHDNIINFSTTPQWMWKTDKPVRYPVNPYEPMWNYQQGNELVDPTIQTLGDYYARLVSWYTNGGFHDECQSYHSSGHKFKIPYWEVLNEIEFEHGLSPQQYTKLYDVVVNSIKSVSPDTKFVGLALGLPMSDYPDYFQYFLNKSNHQSGTPLDMISYHFYAAPDEKDLPETWPDTFFNQTGMF
jgi:hypothetical protein